MNATLREINGYNAIDGEFSQEIVRVFGEDGLHWSCLGWSGEEKLRWLADKALGGTGTILEIGTHQGVSATILALAGYEVHTLDIEVYPLREDIWNYYAVKDRVCAYQVKDNMEVDALAKELTFDLAFIDGCHEFDAVRDNFCSVLKCGRVIFHDYEHVLHGRRTVKLVDSIPEGCTYKLEPYALWLSYEACGVPLQLRGKLK